MVKEDDRGQEECRFVSFSNMYSHVLAAYQKALLVFWAKSSKTMSAIAESFKGYQYYEFTVIKDLAEPSRLLAERHSSAFTEKSKSADELEENPKSDETLIELEQSNDPVNALIDISDAQLDDQLLELEKLTTIEQNEAPKTTPSNSISGENLVDLLEHEKLFSEILSPLPTTNNSLDNDLLGLNTNSSETTQNNFLPSSLLSELLTSMNKTPSNSVAPPLLQSTQTKPKVNNSQTTKPTDKTNWLDLFAELDPIQNPDAIGKVQSDEADRNC